MNSGSLWLNTDERVETKEDILSQEETKLWMTKNPSMQSGETLNDTIKFATKGLDPPSKPGRVYNNLADA